MPSGHTNRATINNRRPLTAGMILVLRMAERNEADRSKPGNPFMYWHDLTTSEKNIVRALRDRGLLNYDDRIGLTEAGRNSLEERKR